MDIEKKIEQKIKAQINVEHFELINESDKHQHHPNRESGGHFVITVVSSDFNGLSRIERQRKIFNFLKEELKQEIHALSMQLYDISEWKK